MAGRTSGLSCSCPARASPPPPLQSSVLCVVCAITDWGGCPSLGRNQGAWCSDAPRGCDLQQFTAWPHRMDLCGALRVAGMGHLGAGPQPPPCSSDEWCPAENRQAQHLQKPGRQSLHPCPGCWAGSRVKPMDEALELGQTWPLSQGQLPSHLEEGGGGA